MCALTNEPRCREEMMKNFTFLNLTVFPLGRIYSFLREFWPIGSKKEGIINKKELRRTF